MQNTHGRKPELLWIKVSDLYIDDAYQRGTQSKASQANIKYIQQKFSWAHFGALIVCFIPGVKKYAVIDGQHRLSAARHCNIPDVPCLVIDGSELDKQARNFVIINSKRVNMNTLAKFHAAVAAGEPDATAIDGLLKECDIEIPRSPVVKGDTGPRQMQAVSTLARMISDYSHKQLKFVLTIIPEAYGTAKGQMRGQLIQALAAFIKANPATDRNILIAVLKEIDPDQLEDDARAYAKINGGKTINGMVISLERSYKSAVRRTCNA